MESLFSKNLEELIRERDQLNLKIASCIKFFSYILPGIQPTPSVDEELFEQAAETRENRKGIVYEIYLRTIEYSQVGVQCENCDEYFEYSFYNSLTGGSFCSNECHYEQFTKGLDPLFLDFINENKNVGQIKKIYNNN